MAVAFDAQGSGTASGWAHVNSNAGNAFVAVVHESSNGTVTAVSYGGVALSKLGFQASNTNPDGMSLWGKIGGLPTGSNTVTVTGFTVWGGSCSYTGAASFGTVFSHFAASGNDSVTITGTTTGGMCVAGVCDGGGSGGGTFSATSPANLRWQQNVNTSSASGNGMMEDRASVGGGSSTQVAWTYTQSDFSGTIGVELLPAAIAATASPAVQLGGKTWREKFARPQAVTEIVPATQTGAFTASITAQVIFGGVQFNAVPGSAVPGAVTPGMPVTSTVVVTPSVTNVSTPSLQPGSKTWRDRYRKKQQTLLVTPVSAQTFNGILTASATAAATFGGTATHFASLTTSATATAVFADTHTSFPSLTTTATAAAVFAGTATHFPSLTTTATATAVLGGQWVPTMPLMPQPGGKTWRAKFSKHQTAPYAPPVQYSSFTAAATAQAAFGASGTHFASLTSTVTAQAAFGGTNTHFASLNAAATAHAVFTATTTHFASLTAAATAHAAFTATTTHFGHLTAAATATAIFQARNGSAVRPPRNLGGTVIEYTIDGTDTQVDHGGTVIQVPKGGGVVTATLAGTATVNPGLAGTAVLTGGLDGTIAVGTFNGGSTGWTMQNATLSFAEFNDMTLPTVILSSNLPMDLTGMTVRLLLKPHIDITDSDPSVVRLPVTVTNAVSGAVTVNIPHSDVQDLSLTFFRIDVIDGAGDINTAVYGPISYTKL